MMSLVRKKPLEFHSKMNGFVHSNVNYHLSLCVNRSTRSVVTSQTYRAVQSVIKDKAEDAIDAKVK